MDYRYLEYLISHHRRELEQEAKQERLIQELKRQQRAQPRRFSFSPLKERLLQVRAWLQTVIRWRVRGQSREYGKTIPHHYR